MSVTVTAATIAAAILRTVLAVNGVYDLLCGCSILWLQALISGDRDCNLEKKKPTAAIAAADDDRCIRSRCQWLAERLASLHPGLFAAKEHTEHPVIRRLLAYWLLTYGMVRTAAATVDFFPSEGGVDCNNHHHSFFYVLYLVASLTYFVEAFAWEYERVVTKTVVSSRAVFVVLSSLGLGGSMLRLLHIILHSA